MGITINNLKEILKDRKLRRVDLRDADLHMVDLSGGDLSESYLHGANLNEANLCEVILRRASLNVAYLHGSNLYNSILRKANLYKANLGDANLSNADLSEANLCEANLYGANLSGAILCNANLDGANLSGANLYEADLDGAKGSLIEYRKGKILTENIIGYKKCKNNIIVTLEIPRGAIVFSINGSKCRTNKAKVIAIDGANKAMSNFGDISYYIGDEFTIYDFDCQYNVECTKGIHFFMTREEAEDFYY